MRIQFQKRLKLHVTNDMTWVFYTNNKITAVKIAIKQNLTFYNLHR